METLAELEAELAKVEGEINDAYWRFTRTASSKVGPPPGHLYVLKNDLKRRIRALKDTTDDPPRSA